MAWRVLLAIKLANSQRAGSILGGTRGGGSALALPQPPPWAPPALAAAARLGPWALTAVGLTTAVVVHHGLCGASWAGRRGQRRRVLAAVLGGMAVAAGLVYLGQPGSRMAYLAAAVLLPACVAARSRGRPGAGAGQAPQGRQPASAPLSPPPQGRTRGG